MRVNYFKCTMPFLFLLTIGLASFSVPMFSQGIIIDHNCTDITQVPDSWLSLVKSSLRVHYAHTSHGSQITTGLERLANSNSKYRYSSAECSVPGTTNALKLMDGQYIVDSSYCETYITPELYWQGSGIDITRYVLNNYSVEISEWAWCSQLDYYNSTEVQEYLNTMSQLESEYPGVTFVYMTGNAQSAESNRESRNNQIRNYCRTNNKVLFDFGDLDCWYNGQQYKQGSLPMEHPHYHGDEAGHTTYESCENKARAYWWMLARIAGWNGAVTTNPVIGLNKTQLNFNYEINGTTPTSQTFNISNTGTGTLNWSVNDNAGWLSCSPSSGTNNGTVTVSVNPTGLGVGSYTAVITVSSTNASNSPQTVNVTLNVTNPINPPEISVNPTELYFGAIVSGPVTGTQNVKIENTGGNTLNWSTVSDSSWLNCTPNAGSGSGIIAVSVNPSSLSSGNFTGTISISDPGASNSPQTVTVYLTIKESAMDQAPFGSFDAPTEGSTVMSSIPVTGWALDDVEVQYVKIYNDASYIGDAVLVEGARPDVANAYSSYPKNNRAGWGYMLLTYFLPGGGNGTYTLYAKAIDSAGHETTLGSKTIYCDNANAEKPFGAIDTPTQGGNASGRNFTNWGWVLTPQPNYIDADGSTINVYVDGVNKGHPIYNLYRSDIATLFPGYANTNNAVGYYTLDTTPYENGIHTISWIASDNAGNTDGIGSRYFSIQNTGSDKKTIATEKQELVINTHARYGPLKVIKGYQDDVASQMFYPGDTGVIDIIIQELERVVVDFGSISVRPLKTLPIGSTLDEEKGIFYWTPGPGFIGKYELKFIDRDKTSTWKINISICRKSEQI